ncbi:putative nucleotide-diphospho-sugar transferase [Roseicyclus marinus]|uniref:putative nucleotide-diphospho-sugar transferase n=1 Tax=Roseicyclus marinus TaxID=2161673 RepID=UPI00240FBE59|nr:putative nucleotide-diphospho-sugar transferase [Roseicyclus marinus]MDG3040954.1 putative nucleotide-diphospho-sugar transferase [Roseicyclus marinus]
MSRNFRLECDRVGDAVFSDQVFELSSSSFENYVPLVELGQKIKAGNIADVRESILQIVSLLRDSSDNDSISYFSRSFLKRLALHRVPKLEKVAQDSLISIAHEFHAELCHRAFQEFPPEPVPIQLIERLQSVALSSRQASCGRVVLLMVTRNYVDNLKLWLDCAIRSQQSLPQIIILNLDVPSAEVSEIFEVRRVAFSEVDLRLKPYSKSGNGSSLSFIWYIKILAALILLKSDLDVIYSDLDSFWLRDVDAFVNGLPSDTNLFFMTADNMPMISSIKFGVTCGCGFFFARSGVENHKFFECWLDYVGAMLDDQIGLAQMLLESNVEFSLSSMESVSWIGSGTHSSIQRYFRIGVLSKEMVVRIASVKDISSLKCRPVVVHPRWVAEPSLMPSDYLNLLFS